MTKCRSEKSPRVKLVLTTFLASWVSFRHLLQCLTGLICQSFESLSASLFGWPPRSWSLAFATRLGKRYHDGRQTVVGSDERPG